MASFEEMTEAKLWQYAEEHGDRLQQLDDRGVGLLYAAALKGTAGFVSYLLTRRMRRSTMRIVMALDLSMLLTTGKLRRSC